MDITKLVRIKTYADKIGKSTTWVYKIKKNEIVIIDGVKFVIIE